MKLAGLMLSLPFVIEKDIGAISRNFAFITFSDSSKQLELSEINRVNMSNLPVELLALATAEMLSGKLNSSCICII